MCLISIVCMAQNDSTLFKGKLTNKELNVYMSIDFYHKNLKVPGQEVFGEMPGYFGDRLDSRKWLITDASVDGKIAHLSIINDYGSEDLVADLVLLSDGTYELQQKKEAASRLREIVNGLKFLRNWYSSRRINTQEKMEYTYT